MKGAAVMEQTEKDTQQILICYDGSSGAGHAIDAAAALFGPRRAVVLVVTPPMSFGEGIVATSALVPGATFEEVNMADARQRAEAGTEHARRSGLDAEARAEIAPTTWEGIVDVAEELDVSVIVVGSRGLSGLREAARGSVSHDVATHARRPVLIVPSPPTKEAA
jgi:nucleotide-binding universal stress UspA family protein